MSDTTRLFLAAVTAVCFLLHAPSAAAAQAKAPTTTTWYVYVTSDESDNTFLSWMYSKGLAAGAQDLALSGTQESVTILDFGQPWVTSTGVYGAWSFNATYGKFMSTSLILQGLKKFAVGYYDGTGSDLTSTMRVVAGTNNHTPYVTYRHGQEWARMVNDFGTWLSQNSYGSQVLARGGNDIEPDYATAVDTRSWVDGYASVWNHPLYDYGSANGCPQSGTTKTPGPCSNKWTQADELYVAWGASPALPFPEIYSTAGGNAKQWQQISLYSYLKSGSRMGILGPLSQQQACVQRQSCSGIDNKPDQAWSQLWSALNGDPRTAQSLTYSSDIKWRK